MTIDPPLTPAWMLRTAEEPADSPADGKDTGEKTIRVFGSSHDPRQEARSVQTWLGKTSNATTVLLCDRFESRRWRQILDNALEPEYAESVSVHALPDRRYDETNWWRVEDGLKAIVGEYLKLAYYALRYGSLASWLAACLGLTVALVSWRLIRKQRMSSRKGQHVVCVESEGNLQQ